MTQLHDTFVQARQAARSLNRRSVEQVNSLLLALADAVENSIPQLLEANALDLARMDKSNPKYDRLQLTDQRLRDIAADMRSVAALPSPLGKILSTTTRPNGMTISKVSVPFGVIGIIYEARPNVTFDVFSLCTKSGSACLLKGGSDAHDTNTCAVALIKSVLVANGWDENTVTLLPASHEATAEMLNAVGMVDLIIPRGSKGLIDFVRDNPALISKAAQNNCEALANGFDKEWRNKVKQFQTPIFSRSTKGAWVLRFDDILADALELGSLRKDEIDLSPEDMQTVDLLTPKDIPTEVIHTLIAYYRANKPEDSDWVVLPVASFDAYFGSTNFSHKWLVKIPDTIMTREKQSFGVCRYKENI